MGRWVGGWGNTLVEAGEGEGLCRGDTGKTGTRERDGKSNEMAAYAKKGNGLV